MEKHHELAIRRLGTDWLERVQCLWAKAGLVDHEDIQGLIKVQLLAMQDLQKELAA